MPFVAIVEAFVLRLLRDLGMSLGDICTAVRMVRSAFGSEYALASRKITTDGVDVIVDVSRTSDVRGGCVRGTTNGPSARSSSRTC